MKPALLSLLLYALVHSAWAERPEVTNVLFGSCNREYKPQPLWAPILQNKPNIWIWLGDIVYADTKIMSEMKRRYDQQKRFPDYVTLRKSCSVLGIWDDHDYGANDGGRDYSKKKESQELLLEFLDEPEASPRRKQEGIYTSYLIGEAPHDLKIILLDVRYFKDKPGSKRDILGVRQWTWLESELNNNTATVTIVASGIQVLPDQHRFEKWANWPSARTRLLRLLENCSSPNVILLSGDRHFAEISKYQSPRTGRRIFEVTSSGMTHHASPSLKNLYYDFENEPNRFRVSKPFVGLNFGVLKLNWKERRITLEIRDKDNNVRINSITSMGGANISLGEKNSTTKNNAHH